MTRQEILHWGQQMAEKIFHRKHQEEVTIKGWVARDRDGTLFLYTGTPSMDRERTLWYGPECTTLLRKDFPSVQWSDPEPTPATITIKIEK